MASSWLSILFIFHYIFWDLINNLNLMCIHVHCRGRAVSQADIRRHLNAKHRSQICGATSGIETGFSPSAPPFPLSTSSHQSAIMIFIYMFVLRGLMGEAWELSKKQCSFVNLGALDRTVLWLLSFAQWIMESIQGVTGGTDQTSGECSLGQTIPL